jgi:hypothetical protein
MLQGLKELDRSTKEVHDFMYEHALKIESEFITLIIHNFLPNFDSKITISFISISHEL